MPEMFTYAFITRAAIAGSLVALCASILGIIHVHKRFSMIGDGLSHVGFGTLAIAAALGLSPLKVAIPVVIITAVLMLRLSSAKKIKGDASIAVISVSALALGVMVVSLSSGINTDLYNYMFGSILALSKSDVVMSIILAFLTLVVFIIFYNKIFLVSFDEDFAISTGTPVNIYNTALAILTAVTVVLGMRMMGTLLISGLIIFPVLSASAISKSFKKVTLVTAIISVVCFLSGLAASYYLSTPAGAGIIIANAIVLIIANIISRIKSFIHK